MSMRDVKICLIGDTLVGKTSIVLRFVSDTFKNNLDRTVGANFLTKTILVDGRMFRFQIWDTAGEEKYRSLTPMYYRDSAAAIIVYDITNEATFHAVKGWVHELQRFGPSQIVIAIAGNKCDLEDLREVRTLDAQEYASDIGALFFETSAMTASNIAELFDTVGNDCWYVVSTAFHSKPKTRQLPLEKVEGTWSQRHNSTVNLGQNDNVKTGGCCKGGNVDGGNSSQPVNHRSGAIPRADGYRSVPFSS